MTDWLIRNQILLSVILAWSMAQIIKIIVYIRLEKHFSVERLVGSGGMPSSHSSTVCALAVTAFYKYGSSSFEFAVSFVLALIVMHDAMGVRLQAGKQAKILNAILTSNPFDLKGEVFDQKLKELLGHTPLQVLCGAVLGVIIASGLQFAAGMFGGS